MRRLFGICLTIFLISTAVAHKHNCVHDKITSKFKPVQVPLTDQEKQHRLLQYTSIRPIKIVIDESNLNMSLINPAQRGLIVEKLVPLSTEFFRKRLNVTTKGSPMTVPGSTCYGAVIPSSHRTTGVDADLIIYVTTSNEPTEADFIRATSCYLDAVTGRPIAGQINFNLVYLSFNPKEFQSQIDSTVHELTHVLAFSSELFPHFRASFNSSNVRKDMVANYNFKSIQTKHLMSPKVLETAKNYFGCSSIRGIPLENQGDFRGSHWEASLLYNEIMSLGEGKDVAYSVFTLSLLEDSGWYQVDFSKAVPMNWGKGAGCRFFEKTCSDTTKWREFCYSQSSDDYCSYNYKHKVYCGQEPYTDECKVARPYGNGNCEDKDIYNNQWSSGQAFGIGSRCFLSTNSVWDKKFKPYCFQSSCTSDGKISILLNDKTSVLCSYANEKVSPSSTSSNKGIIILCPDPVSFCANNYNSCMNFCSLNGYCVMGRCDCLGGNSSDDCSVASNKTSEAKNQTSVDKNQTSVDKNQTSVDKNQTILTPPPDLCKDVSCGINGVCKQGVCQCFPGYKGAQCNIPLIVPTNFIEDVCPDNCLGNGICYNGVCKCREGFEGNSCFNADILKINFMVEGSCNNNCHEEVDLGTCVIVEDSNIWFLRKQYCVCRNGGQGDDCSPGPKRAGSTCPYNCGPKGKCEESIGKCSCDKFYAGPDCKRKACNGSCNNKGQCIASVKYINQDPVEINYTCKCDSGTTGRFCP